MPSDLAAPQTAAEASVDRDSRRVLSRIRAALILAPLAVAVLLEIAHVLLDPLLSPAVDRLLLAILVLVVIILFAQHVSGRLGFLQRRLIGQNRELLGLHTASLAVAADLSLDTVLRTVVESARELVDTRYGALSVIDGHGRIQSFLTAGLHEETVRRIGPPPEGRGVLGLVLKEGQRLRLDDLTQHPRSAGFPEHHPRMRTLLAVPVTCKSPFRGNLYLSEKTDDEPFTEHEEETLVRFAAQAAIAIDNAFLHRQVRELAAARERIHIAHEMHDGLAQVLAYVNTKSQVVKEYCRQGRMEDALEHLGQLSDAARKVYEDVRAQILELRTATPGEGSLVDALAEYIEKWQRHTDVEVEATLPPRMDVAPEVELQLLRIVQESLTNVRKHSHASSVRIDLNAEDRAVVLTVADDGVGIDPDRHDETPYAPRFGLTTMRERAEAIGGRLEVLSNPGGGTTVRVELPSSFLTERKEALNATSRS